MENFLAILNESWGTYRSTENRKARAIAQMTPPVQYLCPISGTYHFKILSHPQVTKGCNPSSVRVRASEAKGMTLPFYLKTMLGSVSKHKFMVSADYVCWFSVVEGSVPSKLREHLYREWPWALQHLWILPHTASSHATTMTFPLMEWHWNAAAFAGKTS